MKTIIIISALILLFGCGPAYEYDEALAWEVITKEYPDSEINQINHIDYYIRKPDGSVWRVEMNFEEVITQRTMIFKN